MKRLLLPLLAVTVLLSSCVSDKEKARRKLEKNKEQNNEYVSKCLEDLGAEDLELKSWPRKQNCRAVDVNLIDDFDLANKVKKPNMEGYWRKLDKAATIF